MSLTQPRHHFIHMWYQGLKWLRKHLILGWVLLYVAVHYYMVNYFKCWHKNSTSLDVIIHSPSSTWSPSYFCSSCCLRCIGDGVKPSQHTVVTYSWQCFPHTAGNAKDNYQKFVFLCFGCFISSFAVIWRLYLIFLRVKTHRLITFRFAHASYLSECVTRSFYSHKHKKNSFPMSKCAVILFDS